MHSGYEFNSLAFITQGGPVSITVALILLVMSVSSWYLILSRAFQAVRLRGASRQYAQRFWEAPSLDVAIREQPTHLPVARLAAEAVDAAEHYQRHAKQAAEACTQDEFIARSMRRVIAEEGAKLEGGLTVLASVGSIAPFVGLFGTVWGIYHALASISISGQATLDKVAGPVGEALIMTAIGLAVAIPAVLGYNALVRNNRVLMSSLESFANDLHILLTTGAPLVPANRPSNIKLHGRLKEVNA